MPLFSETAIVLGTSIFDSNNLPYDFKNWDTEYRAEKGLAHYKLPDGKVIIIFLYSVRTLFSTIRRHTDWKEAYYKNLIGQEIEIVIELNDKKQLQLVR